jgi:tetratricopeptide (TPR) repeat protein
MNIPGFAMKTNRSMFFLACLVSISFLLPVFPAFAEDSTLEVKCVDAAGSPVQGVKVVIFQLKSQKSKDKKSDAQGNAVFDKLDDGAYRVVARKDGFVPALHEFAVLKSSQETLTLKLAPGADRKLHFEDPAEEARAFELLKLGIEAYKQNKFADAEKLFVQCVETNPAYAEASYYLAVSYLQQGKYDQGLEMLNKTSNLAAAYMTMPPPTPSGPNPYEQLLQSVQGLVKKLPSIKGENALKQQKFDVAISEFTAAIKNEPDNPENHANLAIALTNAKRFDEALQTIETAIKMRPGEKPYADLKNQIRIRKESMELDKAQAVMNDGNKLLQDGDAAGALKKYEEAVKMVAQDKQSPLWRQIARAQVKLDQQDAAVASFKKSIELAPADKIAEYRNAFAQYYLDGQRFEDALDVLADPKNAGSQSVEQVLISLANSSKNKQPQLAEAALERVLKANPENVDVYFDLGQMYYADGKEKDSRTKELLTKFVEIGKDPDKIESAKNMLIMISRRSK